MNIPWKKQLQHHQRQQALVTMHSKYITTGHQTYMLLIGMSYRTLTSYACPTGHIFLLGMS